MICDWPNYIDVGSALNEPMNMSHSLLCKDEELDLYKKKLSDLAREYYLLRTVSSTVTSTTHQLINSTSTRLEVKRCNPHSARTTHFHFHYIPNTVKYRNYLHITTIFLQT